MMSKFVYGRVLGISLVVVNFLLIHYDRIIIFLLFNYLRIRVNNKIIRFLFELVVLLPSIYFSINVFIVVFNVYSRFMSVSILLFWLILLIGMRWLVVKSNYLYMPLPDDYFDEDNN